MIQLPYFQKIKAKNKQGYNWRCVLEAPPDPVSGKRKQISRTAITKKEALARAEEALKKLVEDGIDEKIVRNLTFEEVANEWFDLYSKTGVKNSTLDQREFQMNYLIKRLGKMKIAQITSRMYQKVLNEMHDIGYVYKNIDGKPLYKPYSKNTIINTHATANMIFNYAVQYKIIKENPAKVTKIPERVLTVEEIENNSIEETYFEKEELEEFLRVVDQQGLYLDKEWFYMLAFTGMRTSEMLALKWSDIDFETNEIRIIKTNYNKTNNMKKYKLTPPKTNASIRTIYVDEIVIKMLKEHKVHQNKIIMANRMISDGKGGYIKNIDFHDGNFVFAHKNGYPYTKKHVYERMKRLMAKTTITKHLTPHSFRHTHISLLAEAGVDLTSIMNRVGHDDQETTLKVYTHVTVKMKQKTNKKIQKYFTEIISNVSNQQEM